MLVMTGPPLASFHACPEWDSNPHTLSSKDF